MKKKKNKKTTAKLGLLFTILLILLASVSISYSAWTDTITIYGTINTGNWEETAWARMYDKPYDFTYEFPGSSWATYIIHRPTEELVTFYLYAAQYYRVGELIIWKNTTHLFIEYDLDDGCSMLESHLHVNTSLDGIPQTEDGNPIIGHFNYTNYHNPHVTEYTYMIPWDQSWNNHDLLYISAHAVVWGIYL